MQGEQLKIFGNIIEFPKNKLVNEKLLKDKLEVAYKILDYLTDYGADFQILIESDSARNLFNEEDLNREFVTLTSNLEKSQKLKVSTCVYPIKGDEF